MKVWENSKKLWKHSPAARVPTAFLVIPNFHSCFYLNNWVFLSRNYWLIVAPPKFDILKTNICPRSELLRYMIGLKNSRRFFIQSEVKTNTHCDSLALAFYLAPCVSYTYLLRVLTGSLYCPCPLSLARVITLFLVLRHSIEKRSVRYQRVLVNGHNPS